MAVKTAVPIEPRTLVSKIRKSDKSKKRMQVLTINIIRGTDVERLLGRVTIEIRPSMRAI
jgi:hypothetical protein